MAKFMHVLGEEFREPRRRSRSAWVIPLALAAAAFPVLYEAGLLVLARWKVMLGSYYEPRTPVLDWIADAWRSGRDELSYRFPALAHPGDWRPVVVVPAVIAMALFAGFFLRRGD